MRKTIEFTVPVPCHENWNNMSPNEQGRFCASCQKSVVDFTDMTDHELLLFFKNKATQTCGRFRTDQLNKEILLEQPKKINWFKYFLQLCIPTLLVACDEKSHRKVSASREKKVMTNYNRNRTFDINQRSKECMNKETVTLGLVGSIEPQPIVGIHNISDTEAYEVLGTPSVIVGDIVPVVVSEPPPVILGDTTAVANPYFELPREEIIPDTSIPMRKLRRKKPVFHSQPLPPENPTEPIDIIKSQSVADLPQCNKRLIEENLSSGVIVTVVKTRPTVISQIKKSAVDSINTLFRKSSNNFKTYPNPLRAASNLSLEFNVRERGRYTVSIVDMNGVRLQSESLNAETAFIQKQIKINESLFSGQYIVQLISPDGRMLASQKLIIEH